MHKSRVWFVVGVVVVLISSLFLLQWGQDLLGVEFATIGQPIASGLGTGETPDTEPRWADFVGSLAGDFRFSYTISASNEMEVSFYDGPLHPDGFDLSPFTWDFGDGSRAYTEDPYGYGNFICYFDDQNGGSTSGYSCTDPVHEYANPGIYTVILTATDVDGSSLAWAEEIIVGNQAPIASFTATPNSGTAPLAVTFNAVDSSDPDGSIVLYNWDFGDGTTTAQSSWVPFIHTYEEQGTYTAFLTVEDNDNYESNFVTRTITVNNDETGQNSIPVATGPDRVVMQAGNSVDITVGGTDTDGDALSISISTQPSYGSLEAGIPAPGGGVTSQTFTYTPDTGYSGLDEFWFKVDDGNGGFVTRQVIIGINSGPDFIVTYTGDPTASLGRDRFKMQFDASISEAESYSWEFENGYPSSSTGEVVEVEFKNPGPFSITLTATYEDRDRSIQKNIRFSDVGILLSNDHSLTTASGTRTGLISKWVADGSGDEVVDEQGLYHGKIEGDVERVSDNGINVLEFSGGGYVDVKSDDDIALLPTDLNFAGGFEIKVKIKPTALPQNEGAAIASTKNKFTGEGWILGSLDGSDDLSFKVSYKEGDELTHSSVTIEDFFINFLNQWVEIKASFDPDANKIKLLLDNGNSGYNEISISGDQVATDFLTPLRIGASHRSRMDVNALVSYVLAGGAASLPPEMEEKTLKVIEIAGEDDSKENIAGKSIISDALDPDAPPLESRWAEFIADIAASAGNMDIEALVEYVLMQECSGGSCESAIDTTGTSTNADFTVTYVGDPAAEFGSERFKASFDASSSMASSYSWEFEGGTPATGEVVEVEFPDAGRFLITLTTTSSSGEEDVQFAKVKFTSKGIFVAYVEEQNAVETGDASGLISHWKFNQGLDLGKDSEGDNNGVVVGTVNQVSGEGEFALMLDGSTGNFIEVRDDSSNLPSNLKFAGGFTVSVWIYPTSVENGIIASTYDSFSGEGWGLTAGTPTTCEDEICSNLIFKVGYKDSTKTTQQQAVFIDDFFNEDNLNQWHHVIGSFDPNEEKLYLFVDGVEEDIESLNNPVKISYAPFTPLRIGTGHSPPMDINNLVTWVLETANACDESNPCNTDYTCDEGLCVSIPTVIDFNGEDSEEIGTEPSFDYASCSLSDCTCKAVGNVEFPEELSECEELFSCTGTGAVCQDICAINGWYGDGEYCDTCLTPDPDCEDSDSGASSTEDDLCMDNDKYGDGTCDGDCPYPDPDCKALELQEVCDAIGNTGICDDRCMIQHWYGDGGVCDEGCAFYDPDCGGADDCIINGKYGDGTCDHNCLYDDPDCSDLPDWDPCGLSDYSDGSCDDDCLTPDPECNFCGADIGGICINWCDVEDPDCDPSHGAAVTLPPNVETKTSKPIRRQSTKTNIAGRAIATNLAQPGAPDANTIPRWSDFVSDISGVNPWNGMIEDLKIYADAFDETHAEEEYASRDPYPPTLTHQSSSVEIIGDEDGDGVNNDADICPHTPADETVNPAGCSESQIETQATQQQVAAFNQPPTATFETYALTGMGFNVRFDASSSQRVNDYLWNLGSSTSSLGPVIDVDFPDPGPHTINLKVSNNKGDDYAEKEFVFTSQGVVVSDQENSFAPLEKTGITVNGFVAQWDFEKSNEDEVDDDRGNSDGIVIGNVKKIEEGVRDGNQALQFIGIDGSYVEISDEYGTLPNDLMITNGLSVSTWVYPTAKPDQNGNVIASTYNPVTKKGWVLGGLTSSNDLTFQTITTDDHNCYYLSYAKVANFFTDYLNKWVHVSAVVEANEKPLIYINGELKGIGDTKAKQAIAYDPTTPLRIGHHTQSFGSSSLDQAMSLLAEENFAGGAVRLPPGMEASSSVPPSLIDPYTRVNIAGRAIATSLAQPGALEAKETATPRWDQFVSDQAAGPTYSGGSWSGLIDDFRIYGGALTKPDIKEIYETGETVPCWNTHCPTTAQLDGLKDFDEGILEDVADYLDDQKIEEVISFNDVVDVSHNKVFYTRNYEDGIPIVETPQELTFFKYNKQVYIIELTASDQDLGTATVVVKSLGGEEKATIPLDMDPEIDPLRFKPTQAGVNLDTDGIFDVYVNILGYFNEDRRLGLLTVVSPRIDLDELPEGKTFLTSGISQDFSLNQEEYPIIFSQIGDGYAVSVNTIIQEDNLHFFDAAETVGIDHEIPGDDTYENRYTVMKIKRYPSDLSTISELKFDKENKASISGQTVKICNRDIAMRDSVRICGVMERELFSLKANEPTEMNGYPGVLFYFPEPVNENPKEVFIFGLADITSKKAEYNGVIFTENLRSGRRYAFKLRDRGENEYSLLTYPVPESVDAVEYVDMDKLQYFPLSDKLLPSPKASGDQEITYFNLPLERMTSTSKNKIRQVEVRYMGEEKGTFEVSSTTSVDNTVDLSMEKEAKLNTYGFVNIKNPKLGKLIVDQNDIMIDKSRVKVSLGGRKEVDLVFEQPQEVNKNALFYYNDASATEGVFTKYIDIYYLLHLTGNVKQTVPYGDDFILQTMKLNSMALELDGKFYLLSYDINKKWNGERFFEYQELELSGLGGAEVFSSEINTEESSITFFLEDNRSITIKIDYDNSVVEFTAMGSKEVAEIVTNLIEFVPQRDYEAALKPGYTLEIGSQQYHLCDTADTKKVTEFVLLCNDRDEVTRVERNEPLLLDELSRENIILTYRGRNKGDKVISFQYILDDFVLPWNDLVLNLTANRNPVIYWNDRYYELLGDTVSETAFSDLKLKELNSSSIYYIVHRSISSGNSEGMIPVKGKLLSFRQEFDDNYNIILYIEQPDYVLVGPGGFVLRMGDDQEFISEVGNDPYVISVYGDEQARIELLKDDLLFFVITLPGGQSRDILLPDGNIIKVDVGESERGLVVNVRK